MCCGGVLAAYVKQVWPQCKVIGMEAADAAGMMASLLQRWPFGSLAYHFSLSHSHGPRAARKGRMQLVQEQIQVPANTRQCIEEIMAELLQKQRFLAVSAQISSANVLAGRGNEVDEMNSSQQRTTCEPCDNSQTFIALWSLCLQ